MDKIFIEDYTYQNDTWKIFHLEKDETIKYFNMNNSSKLSNDDLKLKESEVDNCNYINLSNKINYSMLDKEEINILSIEDNIFYQVYDIYFNYKDAPIILYYCNQNNPFILVQTSSYMDFQYLIYLNKKEIIKISHSTADHNYYFPELFNTIMYSKNNLTLVNKSIKFKKYLFFGFNMNIGHHLWNEISGLSIFLENKEYHKNIEGIIIGPYDFFNVELYLKNKFNFKIFKFEDVFSKCIYNCNINLKDIFPVFLNSHFINNNVQNIVNFISNNYCDNLNDDCIIVENDDSILEISFNLRTGRRSLINQDDFYVSLITRIIGDYQKYNLIKINLLGFFTFKLVNSENDKEMNEECIEQNNIANNIINKFSNNPKVLFKNYIGNSLFYIHLKTIKSKFYIASLGTSASNILNWIFNTKMIAFGPKEAYQWQFIQYNVLNNYHAIYCPIDCIITDNGIQGPFNVDIELFYVFLKKYIDNIDNINNII